MNAFANIKTITKRELAAYFSSPLAYVVLVIFLLLHLRWQLAVSAIAAGVLLVVATWYASPHLRTTVEKTFIDYLETLIQNNESGLGSRLIYLAIMAVMLVAAYMVFFATSYLERLFGAQGQAVFARLLGVLLAALAVQYVADGVLALSKSHS